MKGSLSRRALIAGGASLAAAGPAAATPLRGRGTPALATGMIAQVKTWDALEPLLNAFPWVGFGRRGPVLWEIGFRNCPPCTVFADVGVTRLTYRGIEVRSLVFSPRRGPGGQSASKAEARTVAEIYRTRDGSLLKDWHRFRPPDAFAERRGFPPADPGSEAYARVEEGRAKIDQIEAVIDEAMGGLQWGYPLLLWRGADGGKLQSGYERGLSDIGPLRMLRDKG